MVYCYHPSLTVPFRCGKRPYDAGIGICVGLFLPLLLGKGGRLTGASIDTKPDLDSTSVGNSGRGPVRLVFVSHLPAKGDRCV